MKTLVRRGAAALALLALAPLVLADNCTALAGQTQCFLFKYSKGGHNKFTGVFNADGTFTFGTGGTGTYSCAGGLSLTEVDYTFGGLRQQWYAVAGPHGTTMTGNGKALDENYMYKLSSQAGACGGGDSDADAGTGAADPQDR